MEKAQRAAMTETVLGGVPLPAEKRELVEYAESQDPPAEVRKALAGMPDREYRTLNEVGESVAQVQPDFSSSAAGGPSRLPNSPEPKATGEGAEPGGEAYLDASHESGWIREDPEILLYEAQLVRKPGEGAPEKGEQDSKPG